MKRFSIPTVLLMITLILSACGARGPEPTPTINPVDLQKTMMSAAILIVAQTQAAIPTATPLPPTATATSTAVPTATFPVMQTLEAVFTPIPEANIGAQDPCIYQVMPASLQGETIRIRVDNPTTSTLMVSVYLQQAGPQSQCGYRSYSLASRESLVINDLVVGCYTLWAWNPDPQDYFMVTNGTSCLDTSNTWTFDISTSSIRLR